MDKGDISTIISGNDKELLLALDCFVNKNNKTLSFPQLNFELRKDLWSALFQKQQNEKYKVQCLSAMRILSRDKESLDDLVCEEWINILLVNSNLKSLEEDIDKNVIHESLKVLCNLVYNSKKAQVISGKNETVDSIFKRMVSYRNVELTHEIKFFDMKLLFLITAFCPEVRVKCKEKLQGIVYLTEYLAYILNHAEDNSNASVKRSLSDDEVDLVCEILKVLFNLMLSSEPYLDTEEDNSSMRLTAVVHDYMFVSTDANKRTELHTHVINLLTTLPLSCLEKLVTVVNNTAEVSEEMEFEGHNMETVHVLLEYLKKKFGTEIAEVRQQESVMPILTVLGQLSKCSRAARKYLRKHILPPLRDVHSRPEQGNTLRNNLCRLLTTPVTQLRDLVADFLFVLCKENVGRMIKYTGYGNAAGLFASRGLLGKTSVDSRTNDGKYSSDSEDSDTEEYKEYRHGINPVIGCYEPPHPNPTEGMTEEQKEYEAMQLVDLMEKLTKQGIVQPCRIGEDGKPVPITHMMQLQEELSKKNDN